MRVSGIFALASLAFANWAWAVPVSNADNGGLSDTQTSHLSSADSILHHSWRTRSATVERQLSRRQGAGQTVASTQGQLTPANKAAAPATVQPSITEPGPSKSKAAKSSSGKTAKQAAVRPAKSTFGKSGGQASGLLGKPTVGQDGKQTLGPKAAAGASAQSPSSPRAPARLCAPGKCSGTSCTLGKTTKTSSRQAKKQDDVKAQGQLPAASPVVASPQAKTFATNQNPGLKGNSAPRAITRRTIDIPHGRGGAPPNRWTVDNWTKAQTKIPEDVVRGAANGDSMNTAKFVRFGNTPINLWVDNLTGCTTLVLVSRTGVYFTHWWETISFLVHDEWKLPGEDTIATFKRTVIQAMQKGQKRDGRSSHDALPLQIKDDSLKAYLVMPNGAYDPKDLPMYHQKWGMIKEYLTEKLQVECIEVLYDRYIPDKQLYETAAGRFIFKYDPAHTRADGTTVKKTILWGEWSLVHDDEWQ